MFSGSCQICSKVSANVHSLVQDADDGHRVSFDDIEDQMVTA